MLRDRRGSRRPFTVEARSGERGATIPTRAASQVRPEPRAFRDAPAPPAELVTEARRILPNLAAREIAPVAFEVASPRKRGRPPKARPDPAEPIAATEVVTPPASPPPRPSSPAPPLIREPAPKVHGNLAPGERWKRRLGRWCR